MRAAAAYKAWPACLPGKCIVHVEKQNRKSAAMNLTQGAPTGLILRFAVPILFTFLLQQFYGIVDTAVVGQYVGKEALSAVGATGSVNFLIIGFCMGLCNGFVIPIAQAFGARDKKLMRRFMANGIWATIGFGVVVTVLVCVFCRQILVLMQTPENILDGAYTYIFIIFAGIPITLAYNLFAGVIRSLGDSRSPLIFLMIASVIHIGFDIISVRVLGMGVEGPAFATLLAQLFSAVMCFLLLLRRFDVLRISRREWRADRGLLLHLCGMGVPMGLQYSITAIGSVLAQVGVNSLGSDAVAAVSAATRITNFFGCPMDALGSAMATYTGQNVGARKIKRVKQGLRATLILALIYAGAAFAVLALLGKQLSLLFLKPEETAIIANAGQFLLCNGAFYVALALVNVLRYTMQGAGYSALSIFSGVMEMIARSVVGILLVPVFGYASVCFASPLAWVLADAFLIPGCRYVIRRLQAEEPPAPEPVLPPPPEQAKRE